MRHDQTNTRKSVKSLKELRSLIAPGLLQQTSESSFSLRNAIDGERDSVKVAIFKFMSDQQERSVASVVIGLLRHGYERDRVTSAISRMVNEGCLVSHRQGTRAILEELGVRLAARKTLADIDGHTSRMKPDIYRHATVAPVRVRQGRLTHRDGIEAAIWKAMQDHAGRRVETIVEILRTAGFSPAVVKGELLLLEQTGWFEIDRSGAEPIWRLRHGIAMPVRSAAERVKAQENGFDPTQPAAPGSLLAKVQQAQRELAQGAQAMRVNGNTEVGVWAHGYSGKSGMAAYCREQISRVLADGRQLTTMEMLAAFKAKGFAVSKTRLYEVIQTLYQEHVLCREKPHSKGASAAYCYWLAQRLPPDEQTTPSTVPTVLPDSVASPPLEISARLRGVELSVQECGELLRELRNLVAHGLPGTGGGLVRSTFTIKGVELSRAELMEVALYLSRVAALFGCAPGTRELGDEHSARSWIAGW